MKLIMTFRKPRECFDVSKSIVSVSNVSGLEIGGAGKDLFGLIMGMMMC